MGLLSKIALLPLAPVSGVVWLAEQVQKQAESEWLRQGGLSAQLEELAAMHERGEISDEELAQAEDQLLATLDLGADTGLEGQ